MIEEIEDDLCQGQLIVQLNAVLRKVVHSSHGSTAILAQLHNRAREFSRSQDRCVDNWLTDLRYLPLGEFRGVIDLDFGPIFSNDLVDNVRCCGNQVQLEFTL